MSVDVGADGAVGGFDAGDFFKAEEEAVANFLGGGGSGASGGLDGGSFVSADIVVFAEVECLAIEAGQCVESANVLEGISSGFRIGELAVNVGQAQLDECVLELMLLVEF